MEEKRREEEQQQREEREQRERERVEKLSSLVEAEIQAARRQLSARKISHAFRQYTSRKQSGAAINIQCAWRKCIAMARLQKLRTQRGACERLQRALQRAGPQEMEAAYHNAVKCGLKVEARKAKEHYDDLVQSAKRKLENASTKSNYDEWMAAKQHASRYFCISCYERRE